MNYEERLRSIKDCKCPRCKRDMLKSGDDRRCRYCRFEKGDERGTVIYKCIKRQGFIEYHREKYTINTGKPVANPGI